jgi:hypothetical protein
VNVEMPVMAVVGNFVRGPAHNKGLAKLLAKLGLLAKRLL